jgi:serine/threonine-protein kinase
VEHRDRLFRTEIFGGAPRLICEGFAYNARGGAWSPDGQILFAPTSSALWQVRGTGGQPSRFTTLDAAREEIMHGWPQILPGGRFLFFAKSKKREECGVYAAAISRPDERVRLLTSETNALYAPAPDGENKSGYLLWLQGYTLVAQSLNLDTLRLSGKIHEIAHPISKMAGNGKMYAAVSTTGLLLYNPSAVRRQLSWVDRQGNLLSRLGDAGPYAFFRRSPDGRRVVFARESPEGADLWTMDVDRGVPARLTSRPGTNIDPVWSPDSKTVIFASGPPLHIFRQVVGGAAPEEAILPLPNSQSLWIGRGMADLFCTRTAPIIIIRCGFCSRRPSQGAEDCIAAAPTTRPRAASPLTPNGSRINLTNRDSTRYT